MHLLYGLDLLVRTFYNVPSPWVLGFILYSIERLDLHFFYMERKKIHENCLPILDKDELKGVELV